MNNEFQFDFSDFNIETSSDCNENLISISEIINSEKEFQKKQINKVSDMNDVDKMLVEKIIRHNPFKRMLDDSNYEKAVEEFPNSKIIELLVKYVGLSEILAYNFTTIHRYNLCVNPHYHIFSFKKQATFTKQSMKHLFAK